MNRRHVLFVVAILLLSGAVSGCFFDLPPGKGTRAEQGYSSAAPIIDSLRHFRANRGMYPDALDELVPDYLESPGRLVAKIKNSAQPFQYRRADNEYELSFDYLSAGSNKCRYRPSTDWRCSGLH